MSFSSTLLLGLSLFSDVLHKDPKIQGAALVNVVTGRYQKELMAVAFFQIHQRNPIDGEDYLTDPVAAAHYGRVVNYCRNVIKGIFDAAARDDFQRKQGELQALRNKLALSNKPHAQGSVRQLAAKLGVSIGEVRRLKASGELDAALAAKECV